MRYTTYGYKTAQAIGERKVVKTSGALQAGPADSMIFGRGKLSGDDLERFCKDRDAIEYVVMSYATPIAWVTPEGVYKVSQKFSVTTSRHQGQLYYL